MAGRRHQFLNRERYISELPFGVMNKIHNTLDVDKGWLKLAAGLGYSVLETEGFAQAQQRVDGSPTKELLLNWSHKNPTASDLYRALVANQLMHVANLLKDHVGVQRPEQPMQRQPPFAHVAGVQQQYTGQQTSVLQFMSAGTGAAVHAGGQQVNVQKMPLPPPPVPPGDMTDAPYIPSQRQGAHQQGVHHQTTLMNQYLGCNTMMQNQMQHQPQKLVLDKFDSEGYMTTMSSDGSRMSGGHGGVQVSPGKMSHEQHRLYANQGGRYNEPQKSLDATGSSTMKAAQHYVPSEVSTSYPLTTVSSQTDDEASLRSTLSIPFSEIQSATGDFEQRRLIGNGGFGAVYIGEIARTLMAIKVLKDRETFKNPGEKYKHYMAEIRALTRFRHPNIVMLSGYCIEGPQLCLVYEYMRNGSLEDKLTCKDDQPPLPWWPNRYSVLVDAARGLQYLHCAEGKPYVHGDIKSANILLDEHLRAKIADFNLAKETTGGSEMGKFTHISKKQLSEALYGSKAYLPREFFQTDGQFSISTDVFSFGMVIYEVLVGGKALDNNRKPQPYLRDMIGDMLESDSESVVTLRDPKMPNWPIELWKKLFDLGKLCTEKRKKKRPKMEDVLVSLERLVVVVQVYIQTARRTDVNRNEVSPSVHQGMSLESTFSANSDVSSQQSNRSMVSQNSQTNMPVPREQTSCMNEGPSLLDMVQNSRVALSSNDPRLQMWNPPKKGEYALQGNVNVSYLSQPSSLDSALSPNSAEEAPSSGSASTDIYTANDRCYSSPEMGTGRQAQVPYSSAGKSMPYRQVPSRGTGLTEFFNAQPFQLQLQHDEKLASLSSQPNSLHLAQHDYMNCAAQQSIPPVQYQLGQPTSMTSHGQPTSMTSHGQPTSMMSHGQPTSMTSHGQPTSMTSHGQPSSLTSHVQPTSMMSHGQPTSMTSHGQPTSMTPHGQPSSMTSHGQPTSMTPHGQPSSMTSHGQPTSMTSHASTEELNNERNEVLEKSLENVTLEDKPKEFLESTKIYEVGMTPSRGLESSDMSASSSFSRSTSDNEERSRCVPNASTYSATNGHSENISDQLDNASAQQQTASNGAQQKEPMSLPERSHGVSPPPRDVNSAPPSLVPSSVSQEISRDKIKKGGFLPMPLETGDTEEICESDLKDIDL